ncbi:Tat pathway signal sequence domain protein [Streptomyces yaizuensis]|uniref:Tat pathway signal sequence domain protein n=1 Tax=Streptomyces yaizuensis TaxID=2989713 RepID=A0ABQ5P6T8_9ACTN|nr:Tat pathway signal sequence domain protein [Streptomyces sp. YSPA8]GLF98311.1 Tat pathway signal sequence domain protein [Streptomyces sp. YSPA8]
MNTSRRTLLSAAVTGAAAAALPALPALATPASAAAWQLKWSPSASRDGLRAFETLEDDRADSHTSYGPHITTEGDNFRFTMHTRDRDTSTDRQRHEVTGCRSGNTFLSWRQGETWRISYAMYIPSSLKATTTFTHIMQMKQPGTGTSPIVVQSLRRVGGRQTIELKIFEPNILVGRTDLEPLHNSWIDVDFEIKIGDGTSGAVRWALRKGGATVVDATRTGVDTFLADRVRPKWGIYRSLGDSSGSLQDCHLLLTNLRGYQLV